VPSPFTRDQLSPAMQERYGLNRRPVGRWAVVSIVLAVFVGVLAWVAVAVSSDNVATRLITWEVVGPDHVDITYQVRPDPGTAIQCVLRAQDENRIDVGYASVTVPPQPADDVVISTYALRTLAPAYTVELLGCATGAPPRVPPPQFPPGVVPPDQPYS
jgi:hypothetical protein